MNQSVLSLQQLETPLRWRMMVIAIVAAIHAAMLYAWLAQPSRAALTVGEMSVRVTMLADTAQAAVRAESRKAAAAPAAVAEPAPPQQPAAQPAPAEVAAQAATAQVASPNAPDVADVEPDYKASYLNNPSPPYPLAARRLGLQGRVVLEVEVLDIGLCGQINVVQGSGYEVLDNAALRTVKSWHFSPARQAGHAVTRWFRVPINFSLKDSAA